MHMSKQGKPTERMYVCCEKVHASISCVLQIMHLGRAGHRYQQVLAMLVTYVTIRTEDNKRSQAL